MLLATATVFGRGTSTGRSCAEPPEDPSDEPADETELITVDDPAELEREAGAPAETTVPS